MAFRYVPWKRNFNRVPPAIRQALGAIDTDLVLVAVTKSIRPSELEPVFSHLAFPRQVGVNINTLPLKDMGKYSTRNQDGWEVIRKDLPRIHKTYYWETPNFGDAATYGTHLHYQDREVYQREFHEARNFSIKIEMLRAGQGNDAPDIYTIALDHLLDRASPNFEGELLFMVNLLQENCGGVNVFASNATRDEYLGTMHLDWEVFPPENQDQLIRAMTRRPGSTPDEDRTVAERVALFARLRPRAYLRGRGGLNSYVGAQYADDLVVFENVKYGNALYVLYDNWEEVSQRSRTELLQGTDDRYDRIVHNEGWEDAFQVVLRKEKRKRNIRD
ncbi:hypothetical protein [Mesorhizobium sp. IMUNJ 23232]|uniref:hypothetical protein n=1 Tax=Mesorhizobium sp. IMUNJ 23232 TaxID=3376064 RepID=UPI0037AFD278